MKKFRLSRLSRWLMAAALMPVVSVLARERILDDAFGWGDTGAWATTFPRRCDRLQTFERGADPVRILHVATTGNDASGDGSMAQPFASIARAANDATPGTAIRVHAGTYPGGTFLADLTGTATAPIWLGGAPGEPRPLIQGGGEGLHLIRAKYLVIHDLEVADASSNGINADDGGAYADPLASHHLVFRGLSIHDIGGTGNQDCLKLSGVNDYAVLLSSFARCGGGISGSGIDHVGCHRGLIARNAFQDLSANAVQSKGGSEDIEIRWNRFLESGERSLNLGGSTGFAFFRPPLSSVLPNAEARDLRVLANLIEGSNAPIAYVGCVACVVANNTIVDPHTWILRILQETTTSPPYEFESCRDGVFANNLVSFQWADLRTWVNVGANTAPETFTFDHNLWYAWDQPSQSRPDLPTLESGGIYGIDPGLGSDFRIAPSSAAAGAGTAMPSASGDLDGVCYRESPSLGAFETPARLAVRPDATRDGDWDLSIEVGSDCTAAEQVVLDPQVITSVESFEACESIIAGEGVAVAAGGAVRLAAGRAIVVGNGFSVALNGTFSASIDNALSRAAFVLDESPRSETRYSASFWTDFDGLAVPGADQVEHLVASSWDDEWQMRLLVRSGPTLVLQVRDDSGALHATPAIAAGPGWSQTTVTWEASTDATATLSVGDGLPIEISGLDTESGRIDRVRWGAVGGRLENTTGTMRVDDFQSWR